MEGKRIGEYFVFEDGAKIIVKFKDVLGNTKVVKINLEIKEALEEGKKREKSQRNEFVRHTEHLPLTESQINKRALHKVNNVENIFLEKEGERIIKDEIWNLPMPQNRRVYMYLIDKISITEIAKIEHRAIPVVKRSIDRGIKNLQKKLKNFI